MTDIRKFKLSDQFIEEYSTKKPNWGPVGEFTYLRTYARNIEEEGNRKENWFETVRRVVEGCFSIQKQHCYSLRLPWDDRKGQRSAKVMYEKIFSFKFLPPGRSLWVGGSDHVRVQGSAALNNCGFISTDNIDSVGCFPFVWSMDALMLGVGIGFDTKGNGKIIIKEPKNNKEKVFIIPDSREGWVESLKLVLNGYFNGSSIPRMDYLLIRPYGSPIKGFGGKASGPDPLMKLHNNIQGLLEQRIGLQIKSTDIVDIMNMIGVCVIAGNVRRCLPKSSLVHTKTGLKKIEEIEIGEEVLTSKGYNKVKNIFHQGIQKTIKIITQDGEFICTPNHKMAILTDFNNYEWKTASKLVNGDRLISTRQSIDGMKTNLPQWKYEKPSNHSTTCQDIIIPELDEDMAWFIGLFHADGYTYANYQKNGFNAHVSIVVGEDEYEIGEKAKEQLERFELNNVILKHRKNENSWIVSCQNKQIAWYMHKFIKQPKTMIRIPDWILKATEPIKLAYIAGVMDGDGCSHNRPVNIVTTVYREFAKDIQNLLYSCGIESRFKESSEEWESRKGWQKLYYINIISNHAKSRISQIEELNKYITLKYKSQNCNGYPSEWFKDSDKEIFNHLKNKSKTGVYCLKQITTDRYEINTNTKIKNYIPVKVLKIEEFEEFETMDIEVENVHEFFCEGYLTHNSAEIAIGDASDEEFITMKDYNKHPDEVVSHRWSSNNSIFAKVGETDYRKISNSIALNGEPGVVWLDNIRKYGRLKDPGDWKDIKCKGTNPCLTGDSIISTLDGDIPITNLVGKQFTAVIFKNSTEKYPEGMRMECPSTPEGFWSNGFKDVYEITVSLLGGTVKYNIKATLDHKFRGKYSWVSVGEMKINEILCVEQNGFYGEGPVSSIRYVGKEEVFDCTIPEKEGIMKKWTHAFIANGFVSHNCGEQALESSELCCLCETFPSRHETLKEYKNTLKYAYLYAKTVTLLPTHWPETNAVMMKNRRIGLSQSGIIDAFVRHGRREMLNWCDDGYEYVRDLDKIYSDWLCIPRSIKMTSIKPSGSVSLLPGVSPGIHYPHSEYYKRRIRVAEGDPLIDIMKNAGYEIEKDQVSKNTMVVSFPIHEQYFERKKDDITLWEQFKNCADYQHYWADNNVSITVTFKKTKTVNVKNEEGVEEEIVIKGEEDDIPHALSAYEDKLKAISLLPLSEHGYAQAPYEEISKEKYIEMSKDLKYLDFSKLTSVPTGERFCDGDKCML